MTALAATAPSSAGNVPDLDATYAANVANWLADSLQRDIDDHLTFPEIFGSADYLRHLQDVIRRAADQLHGGDLF